MARKIEVIHPPNKVRSLVGGGGAKGGLDPAALARAEAALERVQEAIDFASTSEPDMQALTEALAALAPGQAAGEGAARRLYRITHDLRGQGGNFGYPLVTRIGSSLCRFLEARATLGKADIDILRAHVDALRAILRNRLKGDGGKIGLQIAEELEVLVDDAINP
ncbi:MAG: hypothetical protein OHK0024_26430 [Thalassobaculales bacterium]